MSMNSTPVANRIHIGFFGRRNAGKSSVVNAVTGQDLAVVSEIRGTTTDPVYKSMELLPMGPVVIIDTPGFDDAGSLGDLRVKKARQVLNKTDVAVLVVDATEGKHACDEELIALFREKEIPYLVAYNKMDLLPKCGRSDGTEGSGEAAEKAEASGESGEATEKAEASGESGEAAEKAEASGESGEAAEKAEAAGESGEAEEKNGTADRVSDSENSGRVFEEDSEAHEIWVSALTNENIYELKERIAHAAPVDEERFRIVADLLSPDDFVVLVVPIDSAAPKGRLILPQQQVIRDVLEADATALVVKENGLAETLRNAGKKPSLVITDSQAFEQVAATVPEDIPLTSFSILMARWKGYLDTAVEGVCAVDTLQDGDTVLISEGCTHHRQCDDIGTVKIPRWLRAYTGKEIRFDTTSGTEFPEDVSGYKLVIHCGACMLNEREVRFRMKSALDQGVPFTNYGVLIAYLNGILKRSLQVIPSLYERL